MIQQERRINIEVYVSHAYYPFSPMKLIIDERERDLFPLVSSTDHVTVSKEVLPLGDIWIRRDDDRDVLLVERKTLHDLLASIKDGRYEEQSYRLIHTSGLPAHNVIYVLEGMFSQIPEKDRKMVHSAMTSLNYFKGFSVFRTVNIRETAEWLMAMADKLHRDFAKGKQPFGGIPPLVSSVPMVALSEEASAPTSSAYCNVVKKVKKENITPENISEIVLCQIPGISSTTALAITRPFRSFADFMRELQTNPSFLENVRISNGEGTAAEGRRINKTCIQNIKKYLLLPTAPTENPSSSSTE